MSHVQGKDISSTVIKKHWGTRSGSTEWLTRLVKGKRHGRGSGNLIRGALLQSDIAGYTVSEILAKENKPLGTGK